MKVKFIEVGRSKKNWESECYGKLSYDWLYKQVKSCLLSSNISFGYDNDGENGTVIAGAHTVGRFEIVKEI